MISLRGNSRAIYYSVLQRTDMVFSDAQENSINLKNTQVLLRTQGIIWPMKVTGHLF